jgi:hypothetical protein
MDLTPVATDRLLARWLGDDLQTATMRLVGGALAAAAIVALAVWLL